MKATLLPLLALLAASPFLASCSTNRAAAKKGSLHTPRNWQVQAKADASGDAKISAAIERQMLQRGLLGGRNPGRVEFEDIWRWDIVMYLAALHLRFYDGENQLVATGSFQQVGLHGYPSQEAAVAEAFAGLEEQGAFSR